MIVHRFTCYLVWLLGLAGWFHHPAESLALRQSIGFDLGTSGARISVIQPTQAGNDNDDSTTTTIYKEIYSQAIPWPDNGFDDAGEWMNAVSTLLEGAVTKLPTLSSSLASICISGTSASCLILDWKNAGAVTRTPRMYNYDVVQSHAAKDPIIYGVRALDRLDRYAPARHTARSSTGSLAKLLCWHEEKPLSSTECLCHQADYIALQFMSDLKVCGAGLANQRRVSSDWHNCLKLGYNVQELQWPDWLIACLHDAGIKNPLSVLPQAVVSPGQPMGTLSASMAERFGLPRDVIVVGGTTDSNAAFFAATGSSPTLGTAVTSLGSTLAIKQLSSMYVEDASVGVYSHRFPSVLLDNNNKQQQQQENENAVWLIGGASNVGCAVLRELSFSNQELDQLSREIDPLTESPLSYYPLTKKGERFPVADSNKEPLLVPVPDSRADFLHGILQGISSVERDGFLALAVRGASPPRPHTVYTSGGGSRNDMWSRMRERRLRQAFTSSSSSDHKEEETNVVVIRAENVEASFGSAILAAAAVRGLDQKM